MHLLKKTGLFLFFTFAIIKAFPQEFIWQVGNMNIFDNREYFNPYTADQTIFGSMIYGHAGFRINENNSFSGGLSYLYEFGSRGELRQPDIILFYEGSYRNISMKFGAFPRFDEIRKPESLINDTVFYYRPEIEGISFNYKGVKLAHDVWIDWTGRQSLNRKESFSLGFSGAYNNGIFIYRHHFIMTHVAHSADRNAGEHIRDNGAYNVMAGIDLSGLTALDSLTVTTGILGSYDRIRSVYELLWPAGWISQADIKYRGAGLRFIFYKGDRQHITTGDGFYKAENYKRADFYYERGRSGISGKAQFSMHFIPGIVDLSMSLVVHARLGNY